MVGSNMILSEEEITDNNIQNIKVFPNPASTHFSISNKEIENDTNAELRIYSMFGKELLFKKGIGAYTDIRHISTGIYIVRIVSKNKYYSAKLLINR